jgi:hypothetical protein
MKSFWFRVQYYLLSLWALFLIEVVLTINVSFLKKPYSLKNIILPNRIAIVFLILVLIDLFLWIRLRRKIKRSPKNPIKITKIEEKNSDYIVFISTIVMPLIAIEIVDLWPVIVFSILIIVIFIVLLRAEQIFANPTLAVLRFRFYEIEHSSGNFPPPVSLITKEEVLVGNSIDLLKIDSRLT